MTASAIAAFDSTVHMTNHWLNEIMESMNWDEPQKAYHALRAVLHALRDRLPVNHAAALGAQLPMLVRGIYYEGWNPSRTPIKERKKADFIYHIRDAFRNDQHLDAEELTRAVLHVIAKHVSRGEIESVKLTLPHEIRDLWEEQTHTLWF
jgi:uncharacterized protein (DUF2267 family)